SDQVSWGPAVARLRLGGLRLVGSDRVASGPGRARDRTRGWIGSGQVGSGLIGSSRSPVCGGAGSGWSGVIGSYQSRAARVTGRAAGSGPIGSDQVRSGPIRSDQVGSGLIGSRPSAIGRAPAGRV